MVTPRSLIFFASFAALFVACSSSDPDASSSGSPPPLADGGATADAADASQASFPILPYPPGPYSAEIGGIVTDFRVQGYALSPSQRDSRVLPFRDITLAEVRSKPGCACLMVIWSAAGQNCNPCVEADTGMSAEVDRDPSFCVLEVLTTNFDTFGALGGPYVQPPTRADLDTFTQGNRENYPVGLVTDGAVEALATGSVSGIPTEYVIRVSDMRLVAQILGRHSDLRQEALRACGNPPIGVETLATGIAPRAIVGDAEHVYVADASSTIARVLIAGGAVEPVAIAGGVPDLIAQDAAAVTWAARVGPESFVIERAPKGVSQPTVQVTTSPKEISSLAADGVRVYFTRTDGTVASVPVAGGTADVLASGEADPTSILVDSTSVYWLARTTGEVVQMPKEGGARKTLIPASERKRGQILRSADDILVSEEGNRDHNTFIAYRLSEGTTTELMPDYGPHGRASIDVAAGNIDFVAIAGGFFANAFSDQAIAHFSLQADANGNRWANNYSGGQRDVVGIVSRDGYAIWATNGAAGGTVKRMRR
jgi:hypothetical protein